jgi:hypothetical protein
VAIPILSVTLSNDGVEILPDAAVQAQMLTPNPPPWFPVEPPKTWLESYSNGKDVNDSIPYIIITSPEMKPVFEDFADWKTKKGTPTEVMTTDEIDSSYSGDSLQIRIREYLRYRYVNNHTKWLLIGGDYDHVPPAYISNRDEYIVSDYYYACLDFDWNGDGDSIFGEPIIYGDTTDSFAELYPGRIPAADSQQARDFINKLIDYETDTTKTQHQTRALLTSTDITYVGQTGYCDAISAIIPSNFEKIIYHSAQPADVQNGFLQGNGIIMNVSHAQNCRNFLTYYTVGGFPNRGINYDFFDSTSTNGQYSVFFNATCQYGSILNDTCIARSFLFNPTGWGVGYFGPIYDDKAGSTHEYYESIFEYIFDSTVTEIGKAVSLARDDYQDVWTFGYYHTIRYMGFTLHYFGDPQMNIFTETPKVIDHSHKGWIAWDIPPQNYVVEVTDQGQPVEDALVCLSYDTSIYRVGYTNEYGVLIFGGIALTDTAFGLANITVSKPNCFTSSSEVQLIKYGVPGDANYDNTCNVSDAIWIINYVFLGGPPPIIMNRGDANHDCTVNVTDAVYINNYIYVGGDPPVIGCVETPWGGKVAPVDVDTLDREIYPPDLEVVDGVVFSLVQGRDNSYVLHSNSSHNIHAISLTLRAQNNSQIDVENLLSGDEGLALFWSQFGSLVKIGLIDTAGVRCIHDSKKDILRLTGDFEITRAMIVEILPDGTIASMIPQIDNGSAYVKEISFEQNYPNPFNPDTKMDFSLPYSAHVTLEVYNILGQKVVTLADETFPSGHHSITWNGTNENGRPLAAGVYFSKFQVNDYIVKKKLLLLK